MDFVRMIIRQGLFGVLLAYAIAVQAMLAGPLLAAPPVQHALCLTGDAVPAGGPDHGGQDHGGHECPCLNPATAYGSASLPVPAAMALPMRLAVPVAYAAPVLPSRQAQGPSQPAARGPPLFLV